MDNSLGNIKIIALVNIIYFLFIILILQKSAQHVQDCKNFSTTTEGFQKETCTGRLCNYHFSTAKMYTFYAMYIMCLAKQSLLAKRTYRAMVVCFAPLKFVSIKTKISLIRIIKKPLNWKKKSNQTKSCQQYFP